ASAGDPRAANAYVGRRKGLPTDLVESDGGVGGVSIDVIGSKIADRIIIPARFRVPNHSLPSEKVCRGGGLRRGGDITEIVASHFVNVSEWRISSLKMVCEIARILHIPQCLGRVSPAANRLIPVERSGVAHNRRIGQLVDVGVKTGKNHVGGDGAVGYANGAGGAVVDFHKTERVLKTIPLPEAQR